jgi:hypothetical protein
MPQSLFTSQTPAAPDNADGSDAYSMGTYFTPAVDGTVTHIRWFYPLTGQPGAVAPKANLFRTSDSAKLQVADSVMPSPGTPGAWNEIELDAPITVVGGTQYCATIWTPLRYVATSGGASPWPLTNGDLSAPASAGRFTSGASGNVDFPATVFNNGCYFVDVVFVGDDEVEPIPVEKSWELPWSVLGAESKAWQLEWNVRAAATRSYVLPWAVRGAATRSYVLRWRVLADEVAGLPGFYPTLLASLKAALSDSRLRVESDPSATVGRRSVVVGPPAFIWSGAMCDPNEPDALTFEVYLIESLGERAIERLHAELPALIAAVQGIEGCLITACVPGAFPSGSSDLPCYQITVSQDL